MTNTMNIKEVYEYGDNGNLKQRGQYTLIYGDLTCLGLPDLILYPSYDPEDCHFESAQSVKYFFPSLDSIFSCRQFVDN